MPVRGVLALTFVVAVLASCAPHRRLDLSTRPDGVELLVVLEDGRISRVLPPMVVRDGVVESGATPVELELSGAEEARLVELPLSVIDSDDPRGALLVERLAIVEETAGTSSVDGSILRVTEQLSGARAYAIADDGLEEDTEFLSGGRFSLARSLETEPCPPPLAPLGRLRFGTLEAPFQQFSAARGDSLRAVLPLGPRGLLLATETRILWAPERQAVGPETGQGTSWWHAREDLGTHSETVSLLGGRVVGEDEVLLWGQIGEDGGGFWRFRREGSALRLVGTSTAVPFAVHQAVAFRGDGWATALYGQLWRSPGGFEGPWTPVADPLGAERGYGHRLDAREGMLAIGQNFALEFTVDAQSWQVLTWTEKSPGNSITRSMTWDAEDTLWVGTRDSQLLEHFDGRLLDRSSRLPTRLDSCQNEVDEGGADSFSPFVDLELWDETLVVLLYQCSGVWTFTSKDRCSGVLTTGVGGSPEPLEETYEAIFPVQEGLAFGTSDGALFVAEALD